MRWLAWFLIPALCAFTQIYPKHDTPETIDGEFKNVYDSAQGDQLTVWLTTPALSQVKDGEPFIFASTTTVTSTKLMFRYNQEIFAVNASCITVRR